jgi:hypothetical protein
MRNAHIPSSNSQVAGGSERGGHSLDGQLHSVFCAGGLCVRERRKDGYSLRFLRASAAGLALLAAQAVLLRRDPEVLAAPYMVAKALSHVQAGANESAR